ncbi:MAG: phosphodiester glycosidase family protein [Muribaculaceae bacterium]|nr:phosphodiester glycosidase family protein [Muribaculaceae bacterium]
MKRLSLFIFWALLAICASASNTWTLRGVEYQVDTLFHNQVGPGTTQTSLWFHNETGKLRVFYCTIDLTTPWLSLAGVCATDKLAGNERVSAMAERKSRPGRRYFAGINADFFNTSGTTGRGVSIVGTPVGATVVDGEIYRARNNAALYKNFIVDKEGQVYVNPFVFGGTLTTPAGTTATLGGVNTYSSECNNKIVIYTDRYYGSTDQTNSGTELVARLVEGDQFESASPYRMVVESDTCTAGDMTIPVGKYVIRGRGSAATVVNTLQIGDTITISPTWKYGSLSVVPEQVISGNPKILADGVVLDTEGERADASQLHPRSAVGYSDGGNKVYFLVVDGRTIISDGVRTSVLADIMRYAGATDAMNVDGGGSSTLYTSALGVRNHPSDGVERADGNGFFAVCTAPDDDVIASLRFVDFSLVVPKFGVYTPKFYGYNQYGMLIDTDVQGVVLSCPESLGSIRDGSTIFASGSGTGILTGTLGDVSVSAPLTIVGSGDAIELKNDSIITDTYRTYRVALQSQVGENIVPLDPEALTWTSSDESIVIIDENTGVLQGVRDGEASVTGTINEQSVTMKVTVQKPVQHVYQLDPEMDLSTWAFSMSGGKNVVTEPYQKGVKVDFTGSSGRTNYFRMSKEITLWSVPDTLRVRINPGEAPVTGVSFALRPHGGKISFPSVSPESVPANVESTIDFPIDQWIDADDMGNYPIQLNYVQISMAKPTNGQQYTMLIPAIEVIYRYAPLNEPITGDVNGDGTVTAADITSLYDFLLNGDTSQLLNGDVNGDGDITAADITSVYDILLGVSRGS